MSQPVRGYGDGEKRFKPPAGRDDRVPKKDKKVEEKAANLAKRGVSRKLPETLDEMDLLLL